MNFAHDNEQVAQALAFLQECAESRAHCPTNQDIACRIDRAIGTVNHILRHLVAQGSIHIERDGLSRRIKIVGTGASTLWSKGIERRSQAQRRPQNEPKITDIEIELRRAQRERDRLSHVQACLRAEREAMNRPRNGASAFLLAMRRGNLRHGVSA